MKSSICHLKRIKSYIGLVIVFSCMLQSISPLIAAGHTIPQKQEQTSSPKAHNFIQDHNLNKLIKYIAEGPDAHHFNKNLSDPLKRCYKTLLKGTQVLPIEDVWQAMPDILQYVVDYHTKAPRPNAPITESNAIVGPGACDTTQLLELLITIKNKIGCVTDDVCCNTILGILGNACEIFGPDDSISSILEEILNLIQTQTLCCEFPQTWTILAAIEQDIQDTFTVLEELQETLEECCEDIRADIFDTLTILSEEISTITASPCAPTPITGPITITESGPYCLAQDINGTIVIAASNVSLDLNSHQITATSPGIEIQSGLYNISIFNGTITGTVGSTGIEAADSTDIEINDVNFIIDGVGITFNNITNFIINNTQFTNYTNSAMSFTNSQNGRITNSQIQTNNSTALISTLYLITFDGCQQLSFNNIIMTNNTNIQAFRAMSGINTHESTFENIQITSNEITQTLEGLRLENCDNNIINQCAINKNSVSSLVDALFVGLTCTASVDGGSKNNSITECQVHDNICTTIGIGTALFAGINIAGTMGGGSINNNAGANTTINNSSVMNNSCTSPVINNSGNTFLMGINIASTINGGSIGSDACANCSVSNCTITQNISAADSNFTSQFMGINLAGIFGDAIATGTIGINACKNCHIISCNISNNNLSSTGASNLVAMTCINLGSNIGLNLANVINDNACSNCSINDCSLNNNTVSGPNVGLTLFLGIILSSANESTVGNNGCASCSIKNCTVDNNSNIGGVGAIFRAYLFANSSPNASFGTNMCESCSISNCTVNNNINNGGLSSSFFSGIAFGRSFTSGNNCNNCTVDTISICQNNIINPSGGFSWGIDFASSPATSAGGCNNITCTSCLIEGNTLSSGTFLGIFMEGNGNAGFMGGCNNITVKSCEVHNNIILGGIDTSIAYSITGIDGTGIGGANNIQFENCTAKQNISSNIFDGFNAQDISNATWLNCTSIGNSTHGFVVQDTVDSSLQNCKAFSNGDNGFLFSGTTQNVTITNSQALDNETGFDFTPTTTLCHIGNNIAQNNGIGFNNDDGDLYKHQFFGNFAQGNATNYNGINLVTTTPDVTTSPFANVST